MSTYFIDSMELDDTNKYAITYLLISKSTIKNKKLNNRYANIDLSIIDDNLIQSWNLDKSLGLSNGLKEGLYIDIDDNYLLNNKRKTLHFTKSDFNNNIIKISDTKKEDIIKKYHIKTGEEICEFFRETFSGVEGY